MTKKKKTRPTKKNQTVETHYLLILDRSGSMNSCWDATISGLNEQISTIKNLEEKYENQKYFVTLVAFDDEIKTIFESVPATKLREVTGKEFGPRHMTALHDAMGTGITTLKEKLASKMKKDKNVTALVVTMTDGHENASSEYNADSVKKLITSLEKTKQWTFSFMGANIDSITTAKNFGISASNTLNYKSSAKGAAVAGQSISNALRFRSAGVYTTVADGSSAASYDTSNFTANVTAMDSLSEDMSDLLDIDDKIEEMEKEAKKKEAKKKEASKS